MRTRYDRAFKLSTTIFLSVASSRRLLYDTMKQNQSNYFCNWLFFLASSSAIRAASIAAV
jgi:hypothetical protein